MRLKHVFFVSIVILLFVFQVNVNSLTFEGAEKDSFVKVKNVDGITVIYEPADFSAEGIKAVNKLIVELRNDLEKLPGYYLSRYMKEIGEFYGPTGILSKDSGETIQGSGPISQYFRDLQKRDATDLSFRIVSIYVKELKHKLEKAKDNDIVHVAYISISYSFKLNGVIIGPPSGTDREHMKVCDWN